MAEELISQTEQQPQPADVVCADCEDEIHYEEECILLQVVTLKEEGGMVGPQKLLNGEDFAFEPYHFCFDCWEERLEELKQETTDLPPIEDELSIVECACCGSSILEGEIVGAWTVGEFLHSRREPLHMRPRPGARFNTISKFEVLCTYCMQLFNENLICMWEDFPDPYTCGDCVQLRCWRYQACGCTCHEEGESE